ncbi:MAG: prepilin peptidase [Pseudomonadota bacterium]
MSMILAYTFPFSMMMAAILDFLTLRIPNKFVSFFLAMFCLVALLSELSLPELGMHFAAGGLCLLIGFLLFVPGWIGGGDAKFFAVAALWVGWDQLYAFAALSTVLGGLMALILVLYRAFPLPVFLMRVDPLDRLHQSETGIPYGVAMAIAGLVVFGDTRWAELTGF